MAKLNIAPTKSSYLSLKRQLEFAEEGFELLDQKRQILIYELMSRLGRAREAERVMAAALASAYAALRMAVLDVGSDAIDRAALAVPADCPLEIEDQNLAGTRIPKATAQTNPAGARFGIGGTSASADAAMLRFNEVLARLAELAELENAVLRLSRELRKTQRRCNALSKMFIPDFRETIHYITPSLEERERESFVIHKMIRHRLATEREEGSSHG
ncbi:MAG: V-type ATP synthase subunit D [Kiritimatiellales bacterium]|jgi:V/A-type H+-transporting ATPase subunit D